MFMDCKNINDINLKCKNKLQKFFQIKMRKVVKLTFSVKRYKVLGLVS